MRGFSDLRKREQDQSLLLRKWQESTGLIYKGALSSLQVFFSTAGVREVSGSW